MGGAPKLKTVPYGYLSKENTVGSFDLWTPIINGIAQGAIACDHAHEWDLFAPFH